MKIAKETAKKILIILLIVFGGLTLLGGIVFTIGFAAAGWSFSAFNTVNYEEAIYTETQEITGISLEYDTTDIQVYFDETATQVRVEYADKYTKSGKLLLKTYIKEENGKLIIKQERTRPVYMESYVGDAPATTLYLPANRAYTFNIETDTGDIFFHGNATLNHLELETDTGTINLNNCTLTCNGAMDVSVNTGDVFLGNFTAKSLELESDTGDISFKGKGFVESNVEIETSTGDVDFSNLAGNSLRLETDTGDIESRKNTVLDFKSLHIQTSTGDVEIHLAGNESDYHVETITSTGDRYPQNHPASTGDRRLFIKTSTGDILGKFIPANSNN
jgi:hypothetical protein